MSSVSKSSDSGDLTSKKPNRKADVSSTEPNRPSGETFDSSAKAVSVDAVSKKPNGKGVVCSDVPIKKSGRFRVPSAKAEEVLFFRDVKLGPHETELRFRLIHYWEARIPLTKTLAVIAVISWERFNKHSLETSRISLVLIIQDVLGEVRAIRSTINDHVRGSQRVMLTLRR